MRNFNKVNWNFMLAWSLVILTFFFMTGMWAVDVSVGSMLSNGEVVGLFGSREPVVQYHYGLLLSGLSFLVICFMLMYKTVK